MKMLYVFVCNTYASEFSDTDGMTSTLLHRVINGADTIYYRVPPRRATSLFEQMGLVVSSDPDPDPEFPITNETTTKYDKIFVLSFGHGHAGVPYVSGNGRDLFAQDLLDIVYSLNEHARETPLEFILFHCYADTEGGFAPSLRALTLHPVHARPYPITRAAMYPLPHTVETAREILQDNFDLSLAHIQ
jgi:hypothetical protein